MAGGILNLVSVGFDMQFLIGDINSQERMKTFFKSSYKKYTNFGEQKFILNYEGNPDLSIHTPSKFTFKIKRYGDLIGDVFLHLNLPYIWSPIFPPQTDISIYNYTGFNEINPVENNPNLGKWVPYEFKWIKYLGCVIIKEIIIRSANITLQKYSGEYLLNAAIRDFSETDKEKFFKMIGHIPELYDPANSGTKVNTYPNAYYLDPSIYPSVDINGIEPSINSQELYIPLNSFFGMNSFKYFPLIANEYAELNIEITLRPVREWFQIRDVLDYVNNYPYIAPDMNKWHLQFYRFINPPPDVELGINSYNEFRGNTNTRWDTDIYLVANYYFLGNEERIKFATKPQQYLIKTVQQTTFNNITGSNKVDLHSLGFVPTWMFYFQRSDVNLRNEWTNYTNWAYDYIPFDIEYAPSAGTYPITRYNNGIPQQYYIGAGVNLDGKQTGLMITGMRWEANKKQILLTLGILMNGEYREHTMKANVYNFVEKYIKTKGTCLDGVYLYNFCLNTSQMEYQPSGAFDMSRMNKVEFEFSTILPPLDPLAQSINICDPETKQLIGINKALWNIYEYNYDLILFEERYNVVEFMGGICGVRFDIY